MATVTVVGTLMTTGYTVSLGGLSYQPNDLIIGFYMASKSTPVIDSSGSYFVQSFSFSSIPPTAAFYRVASTTSMSDSISFSINNGYIGGWIQAIVYRVRPDAQNIVTMQSITTNSGQNSITYPDTVGSRSIIFGTQLRNNSSSRFTDTDTTAGSWSALTSAADSDRDTVVATQYKQPTGSAIQSYGGTVFKEGNRALVATHILETERGYWGVRL